MGRAWRAGAVGLVSLGAGAGGCDAFFGEDTGTTSPVESPAAEAGVDAAAAPEAAAPVVRCASDAKFTSMKPVPGLDLTGASSNAATLTADELTVVFASTRDGGSRLFSASRSSRSGTFSSPAPVEGLAPSMVQTNTPSLSPDGRTLYFTMLQSTWDVSRASRPGPNDLFGNVVPVGAVSAPDAEEFDPLTTAGGTELWFSSSRKTDGGSAGFRIYRSTFAGASFLPPERALPGDDADQRCPVLSADGRTLWLSRKMPGVADGGRSIMVTRRPEVDAGFTTFAPVAELNDAPEQYPSWISPDDCRLYYTRVVSVPTVRAELWVAERTP